MMNTPKTLIIGIYMHGILPLDKNGEMQMQKVPKGLRITTINSVAPGITNISNIETIETIAKQLSSKVKTKKNYNKLTKTQITNLTENIRDSLVNENKQHAFNIIKEYQHQYQYQYQYKVNTDFQHFAYQYDNSFKIKTYESYDNIPDKLFIKFTNGEHSNPNNFPEHYFNKIILYNLHELNLFEMLKTCGLTIEHISMEYLMEYFVSLGVQNLIIVDLSCSTFNADDNIISDRHIRQVRRHML